MLLSPHLSSATNSAAHKIHPATIRPPSPNFHSLISIPLFTFPYFHSLVSIPLCPSPCSHPLVPIPLAPNPPTANSLGIQLLAAQPCRQTLPSTPYPLIFPLLVAVQLTLNLTIILYDEHFRCYSAPNLPDKYCRLPFRLTFPLLVYLLLHEKILSFYQPLKVSNARWRPTFR